MDRSMRAVRHNRDLQRLSVNSTVWRGALALLFVLALALRLAVLAQSRGSVQFDVPILDSRFYLENGRAIASGVGLPPRPYFMSPGYIWFVAAFSWLFDSPQGPLAVVQIVIDSLTCLLAALLAGRLFGRTAGLIAGFLLAVNGYQILSATRILPETVAAFLMVVLCLTFSGSKEKLSPWRLFFSGALLGLLALFRSNALLILPFLGIAFWLKRGAGGFRTAALRFALCLTGTAAAILPVTLRNVIVGGDQVLIASSGGVNFYLGNVAGSDGRFISLNQLPLAPGRFHDDPSGGNFEHSIHAFAEEQEGKRLKPSEVSAFWMDLAWAEIGKHPTEWFGLLLRKSFLFFNAFEIPQVDNLYFLTRYLPLLKPLSYTSIILWPLGLFGLALLLLCLIRSSLTSRVHVRTEETSPVLLIFTAYFLSVVVFFVTARHRLPAVPLVACFAGCAVSYLINLFRSSFHRPLFFSLVGLTAGAIFANLNPALGQRYAMGTAEPKQSGRWFRPGGEFLDFASQHNNTAALLLERGDAADAERECREGLVLKPQHPTLLFNLGRALEAQGKFTEAQQVLERSLMVSPNNADVAARLGDLRYKAGNFAGAREALEEAVRLAPSLANAWNTLGPTRYKLGDTEGALAALREAERLAPGWVQPRYNLGLLLSRLGRYNEAIPKLDSLHRENPANREFALSLASALVGAKRFGEAEPLLNELLAKNTNDAGVLLNLAELNLARGAKDRARTFIFQVLAANPKNARALELLRASGPKQEPKRQTP